MRERPILFNGAMVRAILSGAKTQSRQAIKDQPTLPTEHWQQCRGRWMGTGTSRATGGTHQTWGWAACPFGQPGDRLWVREAFGLQVRHYGGGAGEHIVYRATNPDAVYCKWACGTDYPVKWKPSIHMPRQSCRLVLEITDVRVERLQAISEADALAEGIEPSSMEGFKGAGMERPAGFAFRELWTGTGGDWESNPCVWVIGFRPLQAGRHYAASDKTKETRDGRS